MKILRDQYLDYMMGRAVERPLFTELFGLLIGLDEEWRAQGATEEEIQLTAFGFDHVPVHRIRVNNGLLGGHEEVVLEETDEILIKRDRLGRRIKLYKDKATIPLPLDHPVTDMDSWLAIKPWFTFSEERFGADWLAEAQAARARGELVCASIPGGFDLPRQLLGEETLCYAYYEQPELIHDILDTAGNTAERLFDRVSQAIPIDQLCVHEDLAGKSGSLVGPTQIEQFIAPYYRRTWDMLASRGTELFSQDSDGNVNSVIPAFRAAGVNAMYPMEPAAGMDIVKVRETYGPHLKLKGGIDKHIIRESPEAIRRELEYKMQPMMRQGGVVFALDHRIPNGTPVELYRYYVRTAREILGLEPVPEPGWARMAF